MAVLTVKVVGTSLVIRTDLLRSVPVLAEHRVVDVLGRVSPIILPVVSVDAKCPVVVVRIRAEFGLEVEQVEIGVSYVVVDQRGLNLFFRVSVRAEVCIWALSQPVFVVRTEFLSVFLRMVALFGFGMTFLALVSRFAESLALDVLTKLWAVVTIAGVSSPVSIIVVENALTKTMSRFLATLVYFETMEV
jgi:hypothetical protein